ncbi:LpxI family protein [Shimia thalassica]|uniref:LpxI family protein n=1 Tax=Shimia thalassica TaxID=1715693 RepID=UPI0027329467|nr:UDP-2,3-diacylglucosamine diphosphatase LpxI [Shimia thalassica]MDP2517538.1 UDP-2,3-diacylglucosamine diphosphatase LpxI [Shimia thalassica]
MTDLAILSGAGALPVMLAEAHPEAIRVVFHGVDNAMSAPLAEHRFEQLGTLFEDLKAQGVTRVVLAGAMSRPALDPAQLDPFMMQLAPRLMAAMQGGDDAILRLIIAVFEEQGFSVVGAHELLPQITAEDGVIAGAEPSKAQLADASRAADILLALSPLDVGQGAVVAGGLVLGIETLQGTDALLRFVGDTPAHLRRGQGGVLVKAPKRGQDLRVDMPAIGPETVRNAAAAGLEGIMVSAGKVLVLDRPATLQALEETGLFLMARVL